VDAVPGLEILVEPSGVSTASSPATTELHKQWEFKNESSATEPDRGFAAARGVLTESFDHR
jgi:hypothetical protein